MPNTIVKSSDSSIATINHKGKVKGLKEGDVIITTETNDQITEYNVSVVYAVNSLKLNTKKISWNVGESGTFKPTIKPSNATNKNVMYITSDKNVATVTQEGVLTAVSPGKCTITCLSSENPNIYDVCEVMVKQPVDSVDILQSLEYINVGETKYLATNVTPFMAYNRELSYSSTIPSVATVNDAGIVTAKSAGSCRIIAKSVDGSNKVDICTIVVQQPATALSLSNDNLVIAKGYTKTLTANIAPYDVSSKKIDWSSSDIAIATIDADGTITAKKEGTCKIMAKTTDGSGKTAVCDIVVTKPVEKIELNFNKLSFNTGKRGLLLPTVTAPTGASSAVVYESSNTDIVTVNNKGLLTAVSAGTCTITCTSADGSEKSDVCKITVTQPVTNLSISGSNKVYAEEHINLKATVSPKNATNKKVVWSSSDTSIAKVDKNGKVTGVSAGKVTIKCTTADGSNITASKTITVKKALPLGQKIADYANTWVGKTQYVWGGNKLETGVDCSGFICDIYSRFGYDLWYARTSLRTVGRHVSLSEAKPGDIVVYPGHVALYIGDGMVTHASNEYYDIITTPIDWSGQYSCITRVI